MGAWIEMCLDHHIMGPEAVAPFVGAWIEMCLDHHIMGPEAVAPFVGAWIEIESLTIPDRTNPSLPSWERGLKCYAGCEITDEESRSLRGSVD